MKKHFFLPRLFLLLFCFGLAGAELDILCTSDLHGHFEKMPALAAVLRSFGGKTLKIDTGDTLTGTLYSDLCGGKPMIRLLNHLRFDVWVPGNHDFEVGYEAFSSRVKEFEGVTLGAHWHWRDVVPVKWKLFEINGVRAAVIGATDPAMPRRVLPGTDGVFDDVTKSIGRIMPEILAARPHVVILAFHNGMYSKYANLHELCRTYPEIDLILGGHSHKEVAGHRLRHAYFVQAGCHGACAAHVKVKVDDATGRIVRIESALLHPREDARDEETARLCDGFFLDQREIASRRIAATSLNCRWPGKNGRPAELGRFFAASLLDAAGADAALVSLPVRRTDGGEEPVSGRFVLTEGILYRLFPFRNRVCTVIVTREDLTELGRFIRENGKKRKMRHYFAGCIRLNEEGVPVMKPEKCVLAVTDHTLVSTPVLREKLGSLGLWRVLPGRFDRDIVRRAFRKAERPVPQQPRSGQQPFRRQY
ncbi:MAG: metallophosphoesterase [Lentisphaeria bacterium]|nr:metallophosphoesterase [Lentisphaeria bacterium]